MKKRILNKKGFDLIEVLVATSIFVVFAIGIYSGITLIFKIVFQSRLRISETSILAEQLEIVRNLSYDSVGIISGVPNGILPEVTTTVRDGKTFSILTTVRNVDDPFDGTVGGTPNDTAPADYKVVEVSVVCQDCPQQIPVTLSTIVAPKHLEGASQNGSLFISVSDAAGLPVVGANVSVTDTAATPDIFVNDVTGNDGFLRIIDTPTGTMSYNINVSKPGYSSDYTVPSSESNPNPAKPPSNVVSQDVTKIYFQIDRTGSLGLHFMDPNCKPIANVPFNIKGAKFIGHTPDVYKYDKNLTANGAGSYSFSDFEWDKYTVTTPGSGYVVGGSIPAMPIDLAPGATQDASVILQPSAGNSLLVKVVDAVTNLPVANATVNLRRGFGNQFNETRISGYGYVSQTDWSGGSGQADSVDATMYFADNGNLKNSSPAGELKLNNAGLGFPSFGWLESSTYDLGIVANFNNIIFNPMSQSPLAGSNPVTFQIAATNTASAATWNYIGPDGTANSFYNATSSIIGSGIDGNRYFRYKVFLNSGLNFQPINLSDVAFTYTASCTPPGQVFFNDVESGDYTLQVTNDGYADFSDDSVSVDGPTQRTVYMQFPNNQNGGN